MIIIIIIKIVNKMIDLIKYRSGLFKDLIPIIIHSNKTHHLFQIKVIAHSHKIKIFFHQEIALFLILKTLNI